MSKKSGIWIKRSVSLISLLICVSILVLSYFSIFYTVEVSNRALTAVLFSCLSLLATILMLYTRKQILTVYSSLIIIPAMLPVILMYYGHWEFIIPIVIFSLIVYFFSGLKEGPKTVISIIYLLVYIVAALVFFIMTMLFSTSIKSDKVKEVNSVSGKYRYELVNTEDSSNGSTTIYIVPNKYDFDLKLLKFNIKGFDRNIYTKRPMSDDMKIEWKTESRDDITEDILSISENVSLNLDTEQRALLGYGEEDTILLKDISEKDFDTLEVAKTGDVLYVNDEPVFRYYIADLERYFYSTNTNAVSLFD